MNDTEAESEVAGPVQTASWSETNLPTFLRLWRRLPALPQLPKPLALFLLAVLGIIGTLVFVVLASFAVHITSRP